MENIYGTNGLKEKEGNFLGWGSILHIHKNVLKTNV